MVHLGGGVVMQRIAKLSGARRPDSWPSSVDAKRLPLNSGATSDAPGEEQTEAA
jgi:hypothetical protein